ncbi:MAG: hypothetical protein F4Y82_01075 [Cenarchaeum sp. SB0665_bin_23]|nr:hypothetical protein [Cenarchaeum sp. SB0667_bin_13]MXY38059.1 hypothetical protein [Cenarchaeum sp. SB0664_bin_35]MXY60696.1 hypothetical protein [Cenarchaeum sp. SB0665_bin_23]MXZ93800.1 hypothetical protein [Cenarchaeum sp. SB0666_bin_15]MYB46983.1 hypothetical protein [Cenarchaeum sp. SB0662_bin_33]MYC80246.1 hypothetical protein [Cenarchaeum sp. SB0661_bin_35]MYD58930.1 hypothetical protein [Cenarchaeum sp. SB0678_bin_8]MYG33553.1 hypothetical protein [Cenarchaeum sp. SB0677_bin_16]
MSNYEDRLDRVLGLDDSIRFVAVADMEGNLIAHKAKPGLATYLDISDTKMTLKHSVAAWKSRMNHYDKIGAGLYTLAVYEKLRRVTVPLKSGNLLLATFGNEGGQQQIIDKVLNEVLYHDYTKS